jgi:hypothetical protein
MNLRWNTPPGIDKKQSHLYNQKENAMDNRPYIKWYAERLHELLLQYPNNAIIADLCIAVERFLHTVGIDRLQAEAPPGVSVDSE